MRISRQGYNGPPSASARASVRLRRRSRRGVATERREGRIVSDVAGAAAVPIGRTSLAVAGSPRASYAYTQRKGKECLARRETFYRLTEGRQAGTCSREPRAHRQVAPWQSISTSCYSGLLTAIFMFERTGHFILLPAPWNRLNFTPAHRHIDRQIDTFLGFIPPMDIVGIVTGSLPAREADRPDHEVMKCRKFSCFLPPFHFPPPPFAP